MKPRDPRLYLDDIMDAIDAIREYMAETGKSELERNPVLRDAVVRRIEVIGEAVRRLPEEVRALRPDVPWVDIIGMRNRLIHAYFDVSVDRVWNVIQDDLPPLRSAILGIAQTIDSREK